MSLATVEVRGTFKPADWNAGEPGLGGQIEFELNTPLQDPAGNVIYDPVKVVAELDEDGHFATDLVATDATGSVPDNARYRVTHRLFHRTNGHQYRRPPWLLEVPEASAGGFIDLADVAEAVDVDLTFTYVLQAEFDTHVAGTAAENIHPGYLTDLPVGENVWQSGQNFKSGRPWFDVTAFTDEAGGADDTLQVRAAAAAAAAAAVADGGALLVFAPGTAWVLSDDVVIEDDVEVLVSRGATITQTVNNKAIFRAQNKTNVAFRGLGHLIGPGSSNGLYTALINAEGSTNVVIECLEGSESNVIWWCQGVAGLEIWRTRAHDFHFAGIVASRSTDYHVDYNRVSDSHETGATPAYGITATGDLDGGQPQAGCSIDFNIIEGIPAWDAIMTHDTEDLQIIGNKCRDVRNGIDLGPFTSTNSVRRLLVALNTLEGTATDTWGGANAQNVGIMVIGYGPGGLDVENFAVVDNDISGFNQHASGAGSGGVVVAHSSNGSIRGNSIHDCGNAVVTSGGIMLYGSCRNIAIEGNPITDATGRAIYLFNMPVCEGIVVIGNPMRNVGGTMTEGVRVNSVNAVDCVIRDNAPINCKPIALTDTLYHGAVPFSDYADFDVTMPWRDSIAPVGARQHRPMPGGRTLTWRVNTTVKAAHASGAGTNFDFNSLDQVRVGDTVFMRQDNDQFYSGRVTAVVDADTVTLSADLAAGRSVAIGAEAYFVRWTRDRIEASAAYDPGNIADGSALSTTVAVAGAKPGDPAFASFDQVGANTVTLSAHVQANDVVRVVFVNRTGAGLDMAAGTLRVVVVPASV